MTLPLAQKRPARLRVRMHCDGAIGWPRPHRRLHRAVTSSACARKAPCVKPA
ncbi:hypothetical protein LC55x_1590 [Lysobacter capsici]|nr:hypothetical protein LC55x_1590 [Lysobacter capsici]